MKCNSFWHKLHVLGKHASSRNKFMTWMASPSFLESHFANTDEGRFAHSCISIMHFVLKGVEPLYAFLHFSD
jgi:hypothetical protein